jgi:hypothetical protein
MMTKWLHHVAAALAGVANSMAPLQCGATTAVVVAPLPPLSAQAQATHHRGVGNPVLAYVQAVLVLPTRPTTAS